MLARSVLDLLEREANNNQRVNGRRKNTLHRAVSLLRDGDDAMKTRSQAVAKIADRTASQLLLGSRDVTILIAHMPFNIGGPLEPSLYLSNGFRDIQRRM